MQVVQLRAGTPKPESYASMQAGNFRSRLGIGRACSVVTKGVISDWLEVRDCRRALPTSRHCTELRALSLYRLGVCSCKPSIMMSRTPSPAR
jgi:hypothetical protein